MAVAPLTAVTPDILAMTWPNADAMRMYFKRRQTTAARLGLLVVPGDDGVVRVAQPPAEGVESTRAQGNGDSAGDGVALQSTAHPGGDPEDPFEVWATEVDTLLEAANEGPERDAVLTELWEAETLPADAVNEIIARRADALERSMTAEEASCPDCDASRSCWGAPDRCEVRLEARLGETPALVVQEPQPLPPIVEGAEHPGVTELREARELAESGVNYSDPIPHVVMPVGNLEGDAQAAANLQLAESMAPPVVAPEVAPVAAPVTEALELPSERAFLGTLLLALETLGMVPEEIVVEVSRAVRQRIADLPPVVVPRKRSREDRLPMIVATLEHPDGASGPMMQSLLGWDNVPGPWFFKEWARKAGRIADLTELPKVDGVRRWRLLVR